MCVYVSVCLRSMFQKQPAHDELYNIHTYIHTCIHTYIVVGSQLMMICTTYTNTYIHTYIDFLHTFFFFLFCFFVFIYFYMCVCVCVCVCVCIYIYIYIYIYKNACFNGYFQINNA